MAETKFTPGPWSIERPFEEPGTYVTCANRRTGNPLVCKVHPENIDANAHLIAAAPELYNALELLLTSRCGGVIEKKAIKLAQVALAKARGEANEQG